MFVNFKYYNKVVLIKIESKDYPAVIKTGKQFHFIFGRRHGKKPYAIFFYLCQSLFYFLRQKKHFIRFEYFLDY